MTTLAIDLGTSAIKLLRTDDHPGETSLDRIPNDGLDVRAWLDALRGNIRDHGPGDRTGCIAVTGQMHGLVTLEGDRYGPGIPWNDHRGAGILAELGGRLGPDIPLRTGGPLASGFQAISLAWLKMHDPNRWGHIRKVMLPKDALIHALTGEHVTDPSDAAGTGMFDIETSDWAWDVVDAIGIPREWLPRIIPSGSVAGTIRPGVAANLGLNDSVEVVIAGGDAPVGAFGAGVVHDSDSLVLLSSGAQAILPTTSFTPDRSGRWYTWPSATNSGSKFAPYIRAGTLLNGGNAASWVQRLLHDTFIAESPTRLIALPHLLGERSPIRDPLIRGAILGLTSETTTAEINRAILEGVAYGLRHALDVMIGDTSGPQVVRLGGGGVNHTGWQEIITNVLGIPTQRIVFTELSALGAAALALWKTSTPELQPTIEPDPDLVDRYAVRYALYRDALDATQPLSRGIAALDSDHV